MENRRAVRPILIAIGWQVAILVVFVGIAVLLRGRYLVGTDRLNPDEAELMAQGRAALRSPVPFTTWTTATTGPIWVLFLALLGALGAPLTIPFAHLLAAVLLGLMGYFGFTLARRALGAAMAAVLTLFWWLPLVLVLTGLRADFATLSTELLPGALILGSALLRAETLARRPLLYLVPGLLAGLAVGAKYQVAPVALALLVVNLVIVGERRWRSWLRGALFWAAGAVAPFLALGLLMVLSRDVSVTAIRINLEFLGSYGAGLSLSDKLANWRGQVTHLHLVLLVLVQCWLGSRSTARVQLCRVILVVAGLAAVFAGGMGFGHYLFLLYTACALATGLPVRPETQLVPAVRRPLPAAAVVLVVAMVGWLVSFGPTVGSVSLAGRHKLHTALSAGSVHHDRQLAAQCPAGSQVLVWGWASELYVDNSWQNAIPFINVIQIIAAPKNYSAGYEMVRSAVADPSTRCVLDAGGIPESASLTLQYPQLSSLLAEQYTPVFNVSDCGGCTVYARR